MAKTHSAAPANDLANVMSFVANRTPEPAAPPAVELRAAPPEPAAEVAPAADDQPADNQQLKGRKEPAPGERMDYAATFLQPVRGRKPKTIYISEDMHTALATITQATPDGIGLSDLLMNIVTHHFETFGPGIRHFLTAQEKLKKTKLPY